MAKEQKTGRELIVEDLAKSGIPERYIDVLRLKYLDGEETASFMRNEDFEVPTYEIPYWDYRGKRIQYSRLKNLQETATFGTKKAKQRFKYLQRPNSPPHLYMPPFFTWPLENGKIKVPRLIITEGEKKAVKACICKLPCVALGGVNSFQSRKRNMSFLPEFDNFDLSGCQIELCFDSDVFANERVRDALNSLAAELSKRGPESIEYVYIDSDQTDKQGLDDFLAQFPSRKEARKQYKRLRRDMDQRMNAMFKFNSELVYVKKFGRMYNVRNQRSYTSDAQVLTEFQAEARVPNPLDARVMIPAIKVWLEYRNPKDTNVENVVFEPGMPKRYRMKPTDQYDSLNLCNPIQMIPKRGSVAPWLELLQYIFHKKEHVDWFLQWLAYPLQQQFDKKPPTKLLQGVFVWSKNQGIGKNFVVEPFMKHIYADTYQKITAKSLEGDFNAWLNNKQFIFGEEIFMSVKRDREAAMGELNALITSDTVDINMKFAPFQTQSNYTQMYLTSNHSNALALPEDDRRMFVIHAPELPKPKTFYRALNTWAEDGGAAKILYHLLERVDCSEYQPKGHAPITDDKKEVIEHSMDNPTYQVKELLDDPRKFFSRDGVTSDQDIFSASEIHRAMIEYAKSNGLPAVSISPSALGKWLLAVPETLRRKVYIQGTNKTTLYCLFNTEHWGNMMNADWKDYYRKVQQKYKDLSRDPRDANVEK